jgi:surfeit locus 1 family protein
MALRFKPFPGLTLAVVIAVAILIALGTWQYKRLQWKTALLSEIEAASTADPFESFEEVQDALSAGDPIDFRRFGAAALAADIDKPFLVFTAVNRDVSWRVFTPFTQDGITVFAALETVSDAQRVKPVPLARGDKSLIGYVRLARPENVPSTKSSPEKNRWFGFNPMPESHNWADSIYGEADMRFYIDSVPGATNARALKVRRPDIRNNHFDYMLTWYGLALTLLVIYLIFHFKVGRLSFK